MSSTMSTSNSANDTMPANNTGRYILNRNARTAEDIRSRFIKSIKDLESSFNESTTSNTTNDKDNNAQIVIKTSTTTGTITGFTHSTVNGVATGSISATDQNNLAMEQSNSQQCHTFKEVSSPRTPSSRLNAMARPFVPGQAMHFAREDPETVGLASDAVTSSPSGLFNPLQQLAQEVSSPCASGSRLNAMARPFVPGQAMHFTREEPETAGLASDAVTSSPPGVFTPLQQVAQAAIGINRFASSPPPTRQYSTGSMAGESRPSEPQSMASNTIATGRKRKASPLEPELAALTHRLSKMRCTSATTAKFRGAVLSQQQSSVPEPNNGESAGPWGQVIGDITVRFVHPPWGFQGPAQRLVDNTPPGAKLKVVHPPPGFEHLDARAIQDRRPQPQDWPPTSTESASATTESDSSRSKPPTPTSTAASSPPPAEGVPASNRLKNLLGQLPKLDTSGTVYNSQEPRSSGSISSVYPPTTMSDMEFFGWAPVSLGSSTLPTTSRPPQIDSGGPTPPDTPPPLLDSGYPMPAETPPPQLDSGHPSPPPTPKPTQTQTPAAPFHMRGVSDDRLKQMMSPDKYEQAKLLYLILNGERDPASVADLRKSKTEFPYVCRREVHMCTLDIIEDCERLQRKLEEMEETKRREEEEEKRRREYTVTRRPCGSIRARCGQFARHGIIA
ncbi:hypothetical protein CONLIGDRAFT_713134 [Coniochaeta ligniaria NRRL 30616]|uniref:Uncharacterized protein n=1 Tax=Coniochaeta ligniaria NRRL 30616 TaxID=1408157 RepID=A0A1J7JB45_9PEZI|nr:hypothetical protein CONLIGDRAFT_713134 [Coniochaeta ligniaria NRRL 30616]